MMLPFWKLWSRCKNLLLIVSWWLDSKGCKISAGKMKPIRCKGVTELMAVLKDDVEGIRDLNGGGVMSLTVKKCRQ
eukprot:7155924-Ditylum_brightwellii.AAC.1